MRKILFITLVFFSLSMRAQVNNVLLGLNNELFSTDKVLFNVNTLEYGLILSLKASLISEDSLTYNSTGNLVTNIDGVNVDLDDSLGVVVGNSVRFGTPTSGTIYQVVDTGASASNLVLNQTFTGSVTDEYYCGSVNTWYDNSEIGNNLTQTTGSMQPKLLWYDTDSVKVYFDGVDDRLVMDENIALYKDFSVYFDVKKYQNSQTSVILGNSLTNAYNFIFYRSDDRIQVESSLNGDTYRTNAEYTDFEQHKYILVNDNNTGQVYLDGDESAMNTPAVITDELDVNLLGSSSSTYYFETTIRDIYIFSRVLTGQEIQKLSE